MELLSDLKEVTRRHAAIHHLLLTKTSPNIPILDTIGRKDPPIIVAIRNKNLEVCKALIEKGADLNIDGHLGKPPIWYAAKDSNLPATRLLLENKARIDLKGDNNPINLLTRFITTGIDEVWFFDDAALFANNLCYSKEIRTTNLEIITELTAAGVPIDQEVHGRFPRQWAILNNDLPTLRFLTLAQPNTRQWTTKDWTISHNGHWSEPNKKLPQTLLTLCRQIIRENLTDNHETDIRPFIDVLPIPTTVKGFLKFEAEIKEALNADLGPVTSVLPLDYIPRWALV